ncbi:MAG: STAS domain-containing protein [Nonomuraea sp.]|uniref:STAS domain-containing protein n=1 Tax=Hamadaea sp. NPDC050747 TaxID=3155789 RepID=UPI0017BE26BB|nr:STAS domain-containing protein [Hamadaea sp.]NUP83998.1 STAS domain-containing protein [Nonomuraea sp.]NUR48261.1 STAS domain-containing protein [Hamadaea sp.]NUT02151.1 STAS domain-containing protein [Hamadaea sp.]
MRSPEAPLPEPVVWALGPGLARADIPGLCDRLEILLDAVDGVVEFDVSAVHRPDAVTVDALARLHLAARRRGRRIQISGASPGLVALLSLIGLADVLPLR